MQTPQTDCHPVILPLGQDGVLVRFSLQGSERVTAALQAFRAEIAQANISGVTKTAASLGSVLVQFDPYRVTRADVVTRVRESLDGRDWMQASLPPARRRWSIPVAFGGAYGGQMGEICALTGQNEKQAIADITGTEVRVLAIGFAPGQPYFGYLPDHWNFARQTQITPKVPAGALVVAVRQLVLFVTASPTGWRQIGQTGFRPFLLDRAEPFLLEQGDAVRFIHTPDNEMPALLQDNGSGLGGAKCEVLS